MKKDFSILIVLQVATPGLGHGILLRVLGHFSLQSLRQVYPVHLGETEDEVECIAQLINDILPAIGEHHLSNLSIRLETEQLQQFGGFGDHSDGQVLIVVKLLPPAFVTEILDDTLELGYGGVGIVQCHDHP